MKGNANFVLLLQENRTLSPHKPILAPSLPRHLHHVSIVYKAQDTCLCCCARKAMSRPWAVEDEQAAECFKSAQALVGE